LIIGSIALIDISGITMFIDIPSIAIVLGGASAGSLVAHPIKDFTQALNAAKIVVGGGQAVDMNGDISMIITFAKKVRSQGLLSIEGDVSEIEDDFLRDSFQLMIDGIDPEILDAIMDKEIAELEARHDVGIGVFSTLFGLAPGFGMIGTLIGLIFLLANLDDPSLIGPSMSAAMLTTLYGSLFANLFFGPLSTKMDVLTQIELKRMRMLKTAIMMINAGDNPRMIERQLLIFITPEERKKYEEESVSA
jgi:chemotaxis protein MotA